MLTAETITEAHLAELREVLGDGHYAIQWVIDALYDPPGLRRDNARRECASLYNAEILNARNKES